MPTSFSSLLTIENSYIEGVNIPYRTNTFHIASLPLLLNLARLIPPHRLATIPSVELLWDLLDDRETIKTVCKHAKTSSPPSPVPPHSQSDSQPSTKFHTFCQLTPEIFPTAREVYIALQARIEPFIWAEQPADCLPLLERAILSPVEDMFRAMGPAPEKEFGFGIQLGGFLALARRHWRVEDVDNPNSVYRRAPSPVRAAPGTGFVLGWLSPGLMGYLWGCLMFEGRGTIHFRLEVVSFD
jgi:hypothetical protein